LLRTCMRIGLLSVVLWAAGNNRASAGIVTFSDRTSFGAQGTIVYDSNFNDFSNGFSFPGDPFTRGDVTYSSDQNLITGTNTSYAPIVNLMTDNFWSPVTGTIGSAPTPFDLFGFDVGVLDRQDRITVDITTNLATYEFPLLTLANGTQSLEFLGYETTTPGEYFTGFSLTTEFGSGSLPGMTNVTLGVAGVPEPTSAVLLGLGLLGTGWQLRRRRTIQRVTAHC
jgi:hypothetical protein